MGDGSNGTVDKVILRFTAPVLVGALGVCGYFFQQSHTNLYNAIERDRAKHSLDVGAQQSGDSGDQSAGQQNQ